MILKSLICLVFGISLLLIPMQLMSLYGLNLDVNGIVMARLYGGAMAGIMMLTWFGRNDTGSIALYATILFLFFYDAINFLVTMWATISGAMGSLGWSAVLIYLFFTVGFGYYIVGKRVLTTIL